MDVAAVFLVITALMAYVNHRFIGLPTTIGVMSLALLLSSVFLGLDHAGLSTMRDQVEPWINSVDFSEVLMQGMLSLLLFAGAMHVDISELRAYRWQIGLLAIAGTSISALLVGTAMWLVLPWVGMPLDFGYCLVFGALISPTDPIAVMGILKSAGAPRSVSIVIAGESLFNDGVGVVLFVIVAATLASGVVPTGADVGLLLLEEAGGGVAFGLLLGYVTYQLLKSIDSYQEEVLLTLAAVVGGYALANQLHCSGPLAMVVAGLIVGNHGRALAMSDVTRKHLDMFWELIDAILNCVLFVLIGLEVLVIELPSSILIPALAAIIVTLLARLVTVALPLSVFRQSFGLPSRSWSVLTWGGLRGGISVALALSLPPSAGRATVLALTYCVVVFSILIQGLTIRRVVERVLPDDTATRPVGTPER